MVAIPAQQVGKSPRGQAIESSFFYISILLQLLPPHAVDGRELQRETDDVHTNKHRCEGLISRKRVVGGLKNRWRARAVSTTITPGWVFCVTPWHLVRLLYWSAGKKKKKRFFLGAPMKSALLGALVHHSKIFLICQVWILT